MTSSVNLENLHEMTGGDKTLEKELFEVYLASSEDCLKALVDNQGSGQEETWRTQAHAWKGMSLNLGAEPLGKLCAEAQINHLAPPEEKAKMVELIKAEYENVKQFLMAP
ncbi:MAG: Hpt domain-containing protein [Alphaproteobacteria bacterium]|nr:Hpt domain-containing protein [Alphaproteobacteria bacterium]